MLKCIAQWVHTECGVHLQEERMATNKIPITARIAADIKALATRRAQEQNRSFASYIEWLILQDVRSAEDGRPEPGKGRKKGPE
jgi:hypothetical protein